MIQSIFPNSLVVPLQIPLRSPVCKAPLKGIYSLMKGQWSLRGSNLGCWRSWDEKGSKRDLQQDLGLGFKVQGLGSWDEKGSKRDLQQGLGFSHGTKRALKGIYSRVLQQGCLNTQNRVLGPFIGILKKGSIQGSIVGTLIIRMGFGAHYTILIIRSLQN